MTVSAEPTTPETSEPLKLTEREIAIASGTDPDREVEVVADDTNDAESAASDVAGKDAENGSGTEAPNTQPAIAGKIEAAWITAEVKREAEANYGLTEDELVELGDEDAYLRTKRVLDRKLAAEGQRALTSAAPAGTEVAKGGTDAATAGNAAGKFQKHDLDKLKAEGYDDKILDFAKQQNDLIDAFTADAAAREQAAQEQAYRGHINEFHNATDALDAELFGKTFADGKPVKLTRAHDENRRKLYDAAETIAAGIIAKAQQSNTQPQIPAWNDLLSRARDYAFSDTLRSRAAQQRTAALAAQSRTRRPAAGRPNRTQPTQTIETDPVKLIANSPQIADYFAKAQESNGVAA